MPHGPRAASPATPGAEHDRAAWTATAARSRARRRWCPAPSTASPWWSPAAAPAWARRSPRSSPASGADLAVLSRKPEHLDAAREAISALGAQVECIECDIRDADSIAAAFDRVEAALRPARRAGQQRRGQLPVADRGPVPQRLAHGRRHHAQRHVPDVPGVRPAPAGGRAAGLDRQRRRVLRLDRRPGLRPLVRGQGRREEPDRDPGRRVGPLRDPGELPGAGPDAARGHDRRHPGQPGGDLATRTSASRRCGSASARSSAGPRRSWRRPTPGSSRATPWSSTVPTGSAATWSRRR